MAVLGICQWAVLDGVLRRGEEFSNGDESIATSQGRVRSFRARPVIDTVGLEGQ